MYNLFFISLIVINYIIFKFYDTAKLEDKEIEQSLGFEVLRNKEKCKKCDILVQSFLYKERLCLVHYLVQSCIYILSMLLLLQI